jgi:hypothetical protein
LRWCCLAAALAATAVGLGEGGAARSSPRVEKGIAIPPGTRAAIRRGLEYLAAHQNPNGSWTDRVGRKVHYSYVGTVNEHVGVTALAGMAFLANGSLPDRGPYARNVQKALEYLLAHVQESTGFITAHESRMYSHAFATLFLAEVYGMTEDPSVRDKLKLAVQCIINSQNREGGWRYLPGAQDSDMSITVCQVMALRAARNAGIDVPKATIDRAILYVKRSYRPGRGSFTYQLEDAYRGSRDSFALTACGLAALYGAGEYEAVEIHLALEFLDRARPPARTAEVQFDYYYGHYYAVQAMFQAGGQRWARWYDTMQNELRTLQKPEGCWVDLVGRNYATAMALIILQMPFQYLPITER